MRRRLDNTDNTNNDLEIKVRKFKSYNANRRKRRPYQRRNIQHEDAAAAAAANDDDANVFDMEFNRPQITSFPITNNNPPDLIDTSNDILSDYTSFLDSQRAKYSNLLEKNIPAHTLKRGNDDDHNAVVSSSTCAALPLPLPPAPPAPQLSMLLLLLLLLLLMMMMMIII